MTKCWSASSPVQVGSFSNGQVKAFFRKNISGQPLSSVTIRLPVTKAKLSTGNIWKHCCLSWLTVVDNLTLLIHLLMFLIVFFANLLCCISSCRYCSDFVQLGFLPFAEGSGDCGFRNFVEYQAWCFLALCSFGMVTDLLSTIGSHYALY